MDEAIRYAIQQLGMAVASVHEANAAIARAAIQAIPDDGCWYRLLQELMGTCEEATPQDCGFESEEVRA